MAGKNLEAALKRLKEALKDKTMAVIELDNSSHELNLKNVVGYIKTYLNDKYGKQYHISQTNYGDIYHIHVMKKQKRN